MAACASKTSETYFNLGQGNLVPLHRGHQIGQQITHGLQIPWRPALTTHMAILERTRRPNLSDSSEIRVAQSATAWQLRMAKRFWHPQSPGPARQPGAKLQGSIRGSSRTGSGACPIFCSTGCAFAARGSRRAAVLRLAARLPASLRALLERLCRFSPTLPPWSAFPKSMIPGNGFAHEIRNQIVRFPACPGQGERRFPLAGLRGLPDACRPAPVGRQS